MVNYNEVIKRALSQSRNNSIQSKKYSQEARETNKKIKDVREKFKESGKSQKDLDNSLSKIKELKEEKLKQRLKQVGSSIKSVGNVAYAGFGGISRASERLGSAVSKELKKPLLKKPSAKVPVISNRQLIKNLGSSNYSMFKSEPKNYQEQPVQDNRNLFFNNEFSNEKKRMGFRALWNQKILRIL